MLVCVCVTGALCRMSSLFFPSTVWINRFTSKKLKNPSSFFFSPSLTEHRGLVNQQHRREVTSLLYPRWLTLSWDEAREMKVSWWRWRRCIEGLSLSISPSLPLFLALPPTPPLAVCESQSMLSGAVSPCWRQVSFTSLFTQASPSEAVVACHEESC